MGMDGGVTQHETHQQSAPEKSPVAAGANLGLVSTLSFPSRDTWLNKNAVRVKGLVRYARHSANTISVTVIGWF